MPEAAVSGATGGAPAAVVAGATGGANNPAAGAGGAVNNGQPVAPAWFPDATAEDIAHLANRGWDKADNAAKAIYQGYRAAEKLIGAEKMGNTVVLPSETADQATKDTFYNRLGRPVSADKYGIDVKTIAGMPEAVATKFVAKMHATGLTTTQAKAVVEWNNSEHAALAAAHVENSRILGAQQTEKLKQEWGGAYDQNVQIVNETAPKLGIGKDVLLKMKAVFGTDGAMKFIHSLGTKVGEGRFIGGDNGGRNNDPNGALTPEQAKLELDKYMKTDEFKKAAVNKYDPNHKAVMAKKSQLVRWSLGQKADEAAPAG